jgi:hypothetical protein
MRISGIVLLLAFAAQTVNVAGRISDLDYIATQTPGSIHTFSSTSTAPISDRP